MSRFDGDCGAAQPVFWFSREGIGMDDPILQAEKALMRREFRGLRAELQAQNPDAALRFVKTFPPKLAGLSPVGGYWPVGSEADPRVLLAALSKTGAAIALPRMMTRQGPARYLLWPAGGTLSPDAFGVPSPPAPSPEIAPRLVLVPLLAFDRHGGRLGQGGGHYDRILGALKPMGVLAVGLAFSGQEVDEVPTGPLDQRLDWIVTEQGAAPCA